MRADGMRATPSGRSVRNRKRLKRPDAIRDTRKSLMRKDLKDAVEKIRQELATLSARLEAPDPAQDSTGMQFLSKRYGDCSKTDQAARTLEKAEADLTQAQELAQVIA